jgi:hypothetical protein
MPAQTLDDVFRQTTREQRPSPELRRQCANGLHLQATRLDSVYRLELETLSRARAEEAGLLCELLTSIRPALPALATPLLVLDVSAPRRSPLVHLRAVLLFGPPPGVPQAEGSRRNQSLFLLDDASFLRLRFTGPASLADVGRPAFHVDRLEGVQPRGVLRDHGVEQLADALARAIAAQTSRRQANVQQAQGHVERLRSLRVLLRR